MADHLSPLCECGHSRGIHGVGYPHRCYSTDNDESTCLCGEFKAQNEREES